MTRPLRSLSTVASGYTRLERAVSQALAPELHDAVPDLADQFASGRPTLRRNSGFGLFTEISGDPHRPYAGPTGDLGTVHVMIAGLTDPVAFTARVRDGRLLGLMGDSYGQDTRAIDFASVPFDQVFTVDPSGRSIPFAASSAPLPPPTGEGGRRAATTGREGPGDRPAARPSQTPAPHAAVARKPPIQRQTPSGPGSLQHTPLPASVQAMLRKAVRPAGKPAATPALPTDRISLLIGAWAVLAVAAVLAATLFDIPWPFAVFPAVWAAAMLRKPKALDALQRGVQAWNASRAARS